MAKVAAIFLFAVSAVMLLAAIFPTQAQHLIDSLDGKTNTAGNHQHAE